MVSCCTDFHEFEYRWIIKKFSLHLQCAKKLKAGKHIIKSSQFSIGKNENVTQWNLQLDLYGPEHENENYFGLHTKLENIDGDESTWAKQEYFLIDSTQNKMKIETASMNEFSAETPIHGFDLFYETQRLLQNQDLYLANDQLIIICQMTVLAESAVVAILNEPIAVFENDNIADDYAKLYLNEKFSDVTFALNNNQKIPAHKIILVARSPVFEQMFEHEAAGENNDGIKIDNMEPEIFIQVLKYIYTNQVHNLDNNAMDLLSAGYTYRLDKLKEKCMDYLCNNLTLNNVMEVFMLAERHNAQRLMKYTQEFINARIMGEIAQCAENVD